MNLGRLGWSVKELTEQLTVKAVLVKVSYLINHESPGANGRRISRMPPEINVANINTIRANLRVLAGFAGVRGLDGFGSRKLQIAADGQFSTVEGFRANLFDRRSNDSLLQQTNINTIKRMFENAIHEMDTNIQPDKPFAMRKEIFDGLNGLCWLAYEGYRTRSDYNRLKTAISEIQKSLADKLAHVMTGDHHALWFNTPGPIFKLNVYHSQRAYIDDPQGGICYGITLDWCRRYVKVNRESILDSSKDAQVKQDVRDYYDYLHQQVSALQGLSVVERVIIYDEAKNRFKQSMRDLRAYENRFEDRLRKKGQNMAVVQHLQKTIKPNQAGNIVDAIGNLLLERDRMATSIQELNDTRNSIFGDPNDPEINSQIAEIQKRLDKLNAALAPFIPPGSTLPNLSSVIKKYENLLMQTAYELETENFYIKDHDDFMTILGPLFDDCHMIAQALGVSRKPVGFMISWNSSKYLEGKAEGHAMGFHKSSKTGYEYLTFDPNFGEARCTDINAVKSYFSTLFSFYSIESSITSIAVKSITQINPMP